MTALSALVVICTTLPGMPDESQMCVVLTDAWGPYATKAECEAGVRALATDSDMAEPAAHTLATGYGYSGPLQVRGGCYSSGSAA